LRKNEIAFISHYSSLQCDKASEASMKLTWAANEVDFRDSFGSNGHGRDGLSTSQQVDGIGSGKVPIQVESYQY
jgi:hypothetical protein